MRKTHLSLTLFAAVASCAVAISACSGGGGGGGDDDDGVANPYSYCEIVMQSESTVADTFDSVYLFAPIADWETGTHNFGNQNGDPAMTLTFQESFDNGTLVTYVVATAGTYTTTAPSTDLHEPLDASNIDATSWALIEGSALNVTMNGTGSFTGGFFNDGDDCIPTLDPEDCIFASAASLPVTVATTSINVGTAAGGIGVALCYDPAGAFAPTAEHQRALRIRVNQLLRERRGY